jgi:hypothetical protein
MKKKLQLKRETISKLTTQEMGKVSGGTYITLACTITQPIICGPTQAY